MTDADRDTLTWAVWRQGREEHAALVYFGRRGAVCRLGVCGHRYILECFSRWSLGAPQCVPSSGSPQAGGGLKTRGGPAPEADL